MHLGEPDRAESLARSISVGHGRASALEWVARALIATERAEHAERVGRSLLGPSPYTAAIIATALAAAGHPDRGESLARDVTEPRSRARALTGVADELGRAGEIAHAQRLIEEITDADDGSPGW